MQFLKSKSKSAQEKPDQLKYLQKPVYIISEAPTGVISAPKIIKQVVYLEPSQLSQSQPHSPYSTGDIDLSRFNVPSPEFRMDSYTSQSPTAKQKDTPLMQQYDFLRSQIDEETIMFMQNGAFYELYYEDSAFGGDFLYLKVVYKQYGMQMAGIPMIYSDFFIKRTLYAKRRVCVVDYFDQKDYRFGIYMRKIVEMLSPGLVQNPLLLTSSHYGLAYLGQSEVVFIDLLLKSYTIFQFSDENYLCQILIKCQPAEILTSVERYAEIGKLYCAFVRCHTQEHFYSEDSGMQYPEFDYLLKSYLGYMRVPVLTKNEFTSAVLQKRIMLQSCTIHSLNLIDAERFSLLSVIDLAKTKMGTKLLQSRLIEPYVDRESIIYLYDSARIISDLGNYEATRLQQRLAGIIDMQYLVCYLRDAKTVRVTHINHLLKSVEKAVYFLDYVDAGKLFSLQPQQRQAIESVKRVMEQFEQYFVRNQKTIQLAKQNQQLIEHEAKQKYLADKMLEYLKSLQLARYVPSPFYTKQTSGPESFSAFGFTPLPNRLLVVGRQIIKNDYEFKDIVDSRNLKFLSSTKTLYKFAMPTNLRLEEEQLLYYQNDALLSSLRQFFLSVDIDDVSAVQDIIAHIDIVICAAMLPFKYQQIRWCFPIVEPSSIKPHIAFETAYHPIMLTSFFTRTYKPQTYDLTHETVLSGSNMSGKSTFLRLVGTLALLAQIGFPVPAYQCRISVFSNLLCRIGGSSLSKINSTFFTECLETANLFNQMSSTTLLLIDELGRGTDQYAGDAIIQAAALELMYSKVPSIIATHSYSVRILADVVDIENISLHCYLSRNALNFQYTIDACGAQSLGVEVAQQAGLYSEIVERARQLREQMIDREQAMLLYNIYQLLKE